jgi:hypothetical protein
VAAVDERKRHIKGIEDRPAESGSGRRRITKDDGSLAAYAKIKSTAGIVIPEVKRVLLDEQHADSAKSTHRSNVIYPSEMARADWCPRATYYRMMGYPTPASTSSFTLQNVFAEGNRIHEKWQKWLAKTGKMWGDWKCDRCATYVKDSLMPGYDAFGSCVGTTYVELQNDQTWPDGQYLHNWIYKEVTLRSDSLPVSGHADGALIDHNCLIEIKSVGVGTLRFDAPKLVADNTHEIVNGRKILDIEGMWKNLHRPLMAHVKQGQIYMWMAKDLGMPFDKIVFLYEFKANQQSKEFVIYPSDEILEPMLLMAQDISTRVGNGGPIPDCYKDNGCGNCKGYEKAMDDYLAADAATWK